MVAQERNLKGYVEDRSTSSPLHGAHIQNIRTRKLAITSLNGTFAIPASVGDSIILSYTGFERKLLIVTEDKLQKPLSIALNPAEIELNDVVITPFPEYWRFKQMILETDPQDSSLAISLPMVGKYAFYDPRSEPMPLQENLLAPSIAVPINLEGLTKRGKEKKKLQKALEQERKWKIASEKFNRQWVKDLTELEGEVLTNFIAFCNFSADYIIETHLLELKAEILVLLSEFKASAAPDETPYTPGA